MNGNLEHAVVVGASMSGLLAARVLSRHFRRVTLVERDALPWQDAPRKGVPQGRHAHGLLARGREVLEHYFPGLTLEAVARGGLVGDISADVTWVGHGVRLASAPSRMIGLIVPRPILEGTVRSRLLALPNVGLMEACTVRSLVHDARRSAVQGVRFSIAGGAEQLLPADLVVDASGRGSAGPAWLREIGCGCVEEERVEVGIGYTTRTYRRRPGDLGGKLAVVVAGSPPNWRNGTILAHGPEHWIVSIGGYSGDHAPAEDRAFLDYARTLPASEVADIVARDEPTSDYASYRFPANLRRRYERVAALPAGYLPFGDALCSFNPVYGQGMTVAAQEAVALDRHLGEGLGGLAARFLPEAARAVDAAWSIAVGNDLRHPQVQGPRPWSVRGINAYVGRLHRAAAHDATLAHAFLKVANLVASPPSLLRPSVALRVLAGQFPTARARPAPARAALGTANPSSPR